MEFTLLGAAAMGVAGVYAMLRWEARRGNVLECSRDLWDVAIGGLVVGVFAGRLAAMIADGVNPVTHPADILIVRAGVSTGFAAIAAIGTVAWLGRGEVWAVTDGLAAATLTGLAGWQAGCVTRDACLGTITSLPWGLSLRGSGVGRHPVELYAALLFALAAVVLAAWRARALPPLGVSSGVALTAAGAIRLVTEPMRPTLSPGPVRWYALAVAVGASVILWRLRRSGVAADPEP
jgi:prolipoprotein diacylglyceryltransferase